MATDSSLEAPPSPEALAPPVERRDTGSTPGIASRYPNVPVTAPALATSEPEADLAAHCRDAASHRFFGTAKLDQLETAIASLPPGLSGQAVPPEVFQTYVELGLDRLRHARYEKVLPTFDALLRLASANRTEAETAAKLRYYRGVALLRLGEITNCTSSHNPYICLLDSGALGAFQDPTQVREAMGEFAATLAGSPGHVGARWLLNISAVLLGTYPEDVPAEWLIPPDRFESPATPARFRNAAYDLNVALVNQAGSSILEDFDNDGLLDLVTTTVNPCESMRYFRNEGDGRMTDVTEQSGLADQLGAFVAMQTDYNNDGLADIFVVRGGWQFDSGRFRRSLLRNNGDGTFTDVSFEAGLAGPAYPSQSAAWGDYDNDGHLDVYIGGEATDGNEAYPSQLFRNNGDGTFTDVTLAAGVSNDRMAKGVAWGDFDNDGFVDLYVSNLGPNRLYRNNGDGTFTDVAAELGVTQPVERSFATWFFDYDNDGWLDLFVANYTALLEDVAGDYIGATVDPSLTPRLYKNTGGRFEDVTAVVGLDRALLPMGSNFGDIDNDGYLDIYLGTGDPSFWTVVPNVLFWNDAGRRFVDVTHSSGLGYFPKGHGIAFGDIDNDGDQDIAVQSGGFYAGDAQPDALFENLGNDNRWLTLKLTGETANRAAIGARVSVTVTDTAGERVIRRVVTTGGSFGANTLRLEIGLGATTSNPAMEVRWPGSGLVQRFADVPTNRFFRLNEGGPLTPAVQPTFSIPQGAGGHAEH